MQKIGRMEEMNWVVRKGKGRGRNEREKERTWNVVRKEGIQKRNRRGTQN